MLSDNSNEGNKKNKRRVIAKVRFGPHYYLEIYQENEKIVFNLGATHHGFKVDASRVGEGLETIIDNVRKNFPNLADDKGMTL